MVYVISFTLILFDAGILFDFTADQNYGDFVKTIKYYVFVKLREFMMLPFCLISQRIKIMVILLKL
jgi:predicted membrane protein